MSAVIWQPWILSLAQTLEGKSALLPSDVHIVLAGVVRSCQVARGHVIIIECLHFHLIIIRTNILSLIPCVVWK
jgi:hypothetical protein